MIDSLSTLLHPGLYVIVCALISMLTVFWAYFKVLKIAKMKSLVDNPDARKLQQVPIPILGGIAVFLGIITGLLVASCLFDGTALLFPVLAGMGILLYTGTIDDLLGLTPKSRIIIEVLVILGMIYGTGMCIDNLYGLWGIGNVDWWIAVPVTVFAGVGIINATNMIDGVNGLSSGLCMACSVMFGSVFFREGDYVNSSLAFIMAAGLLPFFLHNVFGQSSRMFIGDAGTMVMGTMLTWFTISMLSSEKMLALPHVILPSAETNSIGINDLILQDFKGIGVVALTLAIVVVPIADTLRVMTMRVLRGKSPFHPDKTHLHHSFIAMGISHSITTLCIVLIDIIGVLVWYLSFYLGASVDMQLYIVVAYGVFCVWGTYALLHASEHSQSRFAVWCRNFSPYTHFGRKEWWQKIQLHLDAPEFTPNEVSEKRRELREKFHPEQN